MSIARFDAHRIAADYDATLSWMADLGIKTGTQRLQTYKRAIEQWTKLEAADDEFLRHTLSVNEKSALLETAQFIDVFKAFGGAAVSELSGLINKLDRAVDGQPDAADETDDASDARNFLFEAVVAAKMQCPEYGCQAMLGATSDAGAVFQSRRIAVECKRLRSVKQLEKRVRKASDQLGEKLLGGPPCFDYGLVALEVSNLASMDNSSVGEVALREHSMATMDEFINTHSRTWQKIYPEKNRRVLGALIRTSGFIQSESDGLWVIATEWVVNPRNRLGRCQARLLKRFAEALHAGANSH